MIAITAWFSGLGRLARSPWMVVLAYTALLALTAPLGLAVHRQLPPPSQPPVNEPGAGPVPNLDWLDEATAGRLGLLGTLSPVVVGVAAPLDNLDRLLAARRPALFAIALSGLSLIVWSWLWGGIIARIANVPGRFVAACGRSFISIVTLGVASVIAAAALYAALHPLLFDVILAALTVGSSERARFAWRLAMTIPFVAVLTLITLIADYARISLALNDATSVREAVTGAVRIIRGNPIAVLVLVALAALLLSALLTAYGAFELIPGGSVPTLRRVIVLGQALIIARIVLRLLNAAAQVMLYQRVTRRATTE